MTSSDANGANHALSVITVVKDDPEGFTQTLHSLENQSSKDFNWVVVDSSADQSSIPQILESSVLTANYLWVEAAGIYPAMNQGAELASGSYLYFLNAGDSLSGSDILQRIEQLLLEKNPVWAFGGVTFWSQVGQPLREPAWQYEHEYAHRFARGRFPAHQGVFVRHDLFDQLGGFNTSYKVAADYHMVTRLSQLQKPLIMDFSIANFTQGGASTKSWRLAQSEFRRARKEVFPQNSMGFIDELVFGVKTYASHLVVNLRAKLR